MLNGNQKINSIRRTLPTGYQMHGYHNTVRRTDFSSVKHVDKNEMFILSVASSCKIQLHRFVFWTRLKGYVQDDLSCNVNHGILWIHFGRFWVVEVSKRSYRDTDKLLPVPSYSLLKYEQQQGYVLLAIANIPSCVLSEIVFLIKLLFLLWQSIYKTHSRFSSLIRSYPLYQISWK